MGKRFQPKNSKKENEPGPGQYEYNVEPLMRSKPKWSFGKNQRTQSANPNKVNLGPGQYNNNLKKSKKGGFIGK